MSKSGLVQKCLLVVFALSMVGTVQAAVIRSPVAILNAVPEYVAGCCAIARTIDQSGLTVGFNSGVTHFDTYLASNPKHIINFGMEWFAPAGIFTQTIDYDLGTAFLVDRAAIWNEESWGASEIEIFTSLDSITYTAAGRFFPTNHLVAEYPADVFAFAATHARYVRLMVTGTPGDDGDLSVNESVSLGEVAFSTNAIPEPATLGLIGIGLAGWGALRRRKK